MAATVFLGGVGATVGVDDVVKVAEGGASVVLDTACLDRIKKDSPNPKNFTASEYQPAAGSTSATNISTLDSRAALLVRLLSLVNGRTRVRPAVVKYLTELLNRNLVPNLPLVSSDAELSVSIANVCYGEGSVGLGTSTANLIGLLEENKVEVPKLSITERKVLESGQSGSTGIACVCVHTARAQITAATAVAALSFEALKADTKAFETETSNPTKSVGEIICQLCGLLEGSSQVNPRKGAFQADCVLNVPQIHGGVEDAVTSVAVAVRGELTAVLNVTEKGDVSSCSSSAVPSSLLGLCQSLLPVLSLSIATTQAMLNHMEQLASSSPDNQDTLTGVVKQIKSELDGLTDDVAGCRRQTADVSTKMALEEQTPSVQIAVTAEQLLEKVHRVVVTEAVAAIIILRMQQGPEPDPSSVASSTEPAPDKGGKGDKKTKKGGGGGFKTGKGTSILRSYFETAAVADTSNQQNGAQDGESVMTQRLLSGSVPLSACLTAVADLLDTRKPSLKAAMSQLRACVEANQARRKPKIPKGARDLLPDQMTIREIAFNKITSVFKRHGAVSIDTPVFELKETLMGKYGEDSKLIYDLADQGGELLSLRYDLTVPFARYVALHGIGNIKRYHIGKVYRRDQPNMNRGRFREFYQCDFDIAGSYATMVPDAECLKVLVEILSDLPVGEFEVKLNHRKLLDAMLDVAGVPPQKFRPICSAIDKLDKEPWHEVKREMVEDKGLAEEVADRIQKYVVLRDQPMALLDKLMTAEYAELATHQQGKVALEELRVLVGYLETMGALGSIILDMSLARGLDYYTGVIYEAVLKGGSVGSIAAGGRYDHLVGMFSGKDIPAVGVSIGIERVFSIMEATMRQQAQQTNGMIRKTETQVLVASIGNGLQMKRMEIASRLWTAGIKAEFGYKPNPKLTHDILPYALDSGIPLVILFGEDEISRGELKIKNLQKETERVIAADGIVEEVLQSLKDVDDERVVSWGNKHTAK